MTLQVANNATSAITWQAVTGPATVQQIRVSGYTIEGSFLMVFDDTPVSEPYNYVGVIAVPLRAGKAIDFGPLGRPFTKGVYLAISGRSDYLAPIVSTGDTLVYDVIYE